MDRTASPGRVYRGMTEADRQADRTERLLAAAFDLYGTQGFAATTIEQVCREAGITARHFYEAFPSQAALFSALYTRLIDEAVVASLADIDDQPPAEKLELVLRNMFEHAIGDPRRARVLFIDVVQLPDTGSITGGMRRLAEVITGFYLTHLEATVHLDLDIHLTSLAIAGAYRELLTYGAAHPDEVASGSVAETAIAIGKRIILLPEASRS